MKDREYSGKALPNLAARYEQQMWDDIANFHRNNPTLVSKYLKNSKPSGKIFILSTVSDDFCMFREVWHGK